MAYIVTFERNALDQDQVLVRILDDSTGSFVEQARLEIGYAQYNASVVGGLVSVTNKTTLEALFETQPYDLYRRNTVPYNTWGFDAGSSVSMLNLEIGGAATGASPPPVFMFSNFVAGGNTITPENTADTLTFTAGSGISIAGNLSTDTITVSNTGLRTASGTAPIQTTTDLSGNTTVSIDAATTSTAGSLSASDKTKLDGIQAGAQVNAVTSVNTQTGAVVLTTSNITEGTNLYFTNTRADARTLAEKDQTLTGPRVVNLNGDGIEFQQSAVAVLGVDIGGVYGTGIFAYNGLQYPSADGVNGQSITTDGLGLLTMAHPFSQVTTKSATAITLALADAGKYIRCTGATAITVTIPQNVFSVGHEILLEQNNTAQVTIAAGAGVTLRNSADFLLKTSERYSIVGLKCVATNEFILTGEREVA